jgi:hypothetical protein
MDNEEEEKLLPKEGCEEGWLRYGEGIFKNKPFGMRLSERLKHGHAHFVNIGHGDLALGAYSGDPLKGEQDLYSFLLGPKYAP